VRTRPRLVDPAKLTRSRPNEGGQANINAAHGASLWKTYIQPLASQGYRLISPAPTNAPSGEVWLKDFIAACNGCTIDGIATHFYGTDAEHLINHINRYHQVFNKPIWLTEFACQNFSGGAQCSTDQIWAFMKRTTQYMDGQDWVAYYSWFGMYSRPRIVDIFLTLWLGSLLDMGNVNWNNQLVNPDSTPNALGRRYLGLDGW